MKEELLKQLADKMGVAVEVLWEALLKQAPIYAISVSAMLTLLVIIIILSFRKVINMPKNEARVIPIVIFYCVSFLVFIIICMELPLILAGFLNPEYWAIKQIIK
jgi:hypothetical protein